MDKTETKKTIIECDCGTHLLMVQSEVEYFDDSVSQLTRFRQDIYLAMFTYGSYTPKPSLWRRLRIIWNYLKTGEMHKDQLVLSPEEASKLATFINDNLVKGEEKI